MNTKKTLKQCSLEELELAIAKAISEVTGYDADAVINNFQVTEVNSPLNDKDTFNLDLTLKVGREYDPSW
jgi:hypothetical protein